MRIQQQSQPLSSSVSSHKNSYVNSVNTSQVKSSVNSTNKRPFQTLTSSHPPIKKKPIDVANSQGAPDDGRAFKGMDVLTPV